jgi:gluconate 2-dehydrogenase gamma chain
MLPRTEPSAASGIDRREAIRRAALLAGVAFSPEWLKLVDRPTPLAQQPRYLTAPQLATASAIADRILPETDTPGAADVGVPAFIDLLFGEFMTDDERRLLTSVLDETEAAALSAHGAPFSTLHAERQDAVLRRIAEAQQGQDQSSFALIRSATILGYFTSEPVGRTVLHYDPVPGRYEACIPIEEVGRRNWTT